MVEIDKETKEILEALQLISGQGEGDLVKEAVKFLACEMLSRSRLALLNIGDEASHRWQERRWLQEAVSLLSSVVPPEPPDL